MRLSSTSESTPGVRKSHAHPALLSLLDCRYEALAADMKEAQAQVTSLRADLFDQQYKKSEVEAKAAWDASCAKAEAVTTVAQLTERLAQSDVDAQSRAAEIKRLTAELKQRYFVALQ